MRTFKIAAVASAGLLALAGCGTEQGAALFVGEERVPETTLDGYVDDTVATSLQQGAVEAEIDYAAGREQAVTCVMFAELGRAMDLPAPDTAGAASDLDAECIEAQHYLQEIAAEAEPRELTAAELAVLDGAGYPYEAWPQAEQAQLAYNAGLADDLSGLLDEYDVRVNPRYGVSTFPLLANDLSELFEVEIPQR